MSDKRFPFDYIILPLAAMVGCVLIWSFISAQIAPDLPSPGKTWEQSKSYVLAPFAKRGELDQGILRFTWYSLILVAKGYVLAIVLGTPLGFLLGVSKMASRAIDPLIQILRPVSPLAWLPLGLLLFQRLVCERFRRTISTSAKCCDCRSGRCSGKCCCQRHSLTCSPAFA